jgi:hypothetical protein
VPPKLRLGKAKPAFEKPKVLQHGISQKRLNELAEDWDAMYTALMPFAQFAEGLPPVLEGQPRLTDSGPAFTCSPFGVNYVITFADLRRAKEVLEFVHQRLEARRVTQAERALAGHGDVCRLCGSVIEGADDHELAGYCSKTCRREDNESEFPSPDPMFALGPGKTP